MLKRIDPTLTVAWRKLQEHSEAMKPIHMRELFRADPKRFERFSLRFDDILVDFSKNRITEETLALLLELAEETSVAEAIEEMFRGDPINETEGRPVLHVALRNRSNEPVLVEGRDVMIPVNELGRTTREIVCQRVAPSA